MKLPFSLSLTLVAVMLASPASATLVQGDLFTAGDGLLTIDSDTNQEWLDLTKTQGLSYNQALASIYVTDHGFRHSTVGEVAALFSNAGFLTVNNGNNPANDPAAELLVNLMGCTQFCGTANELGRGFADWTTSGWTTRPNYHNTGLGAGAATTSLLTNNPDLVDSNIGPSGHFLVREASVSYPTPEPGAATLFAVGVLVASLAVRRGRRECADASAP
jgi:hypothetical protein